MNKWRTKIIYKIKTNKFQKIKIEYMKDYGIFKNNSNKK